ncbi:MAG: hypothetical protein AB1805_10615 [Nitrospirota bacterium]
MTSDGDEVNELISRYGLEEDGEHVIIPFTGSDGRPRRCFLLKRKFIRVVYPDKHYADYPLAEMIAAIVRYPELPVTESLQLLHHELGRGEPDGPTTDKEIYE